MRVRFQKSKSGAGWFAYDDKDNLIDYFFTKWGAIYGAKRSLKNKQNRRKSFEMDLK